MPIEGRCPKCQMAYRVADQLAGTACRCPACGAVVVVPHPSQDPLQLPPPRTVPASLPTADGEAFELLWKNGRPTLPAIAIGIALVVAGLGIVSYEVYRRASAQPVAASQPIEAQPAPIQQPVAPPNSVPAPRASQPDRAAAQLKPQAPPSPAAQNTPPAVQGPTRQVTAVGMYLFDGVYAGREPEEIALRRALAKTTWAVADSLQFDARSKKYQVLSTLKDVRGQRPIAELLADVGFQILNAEPRYFSNPETREVATLPPLPPAPPPIGTNEPPLQLPATPQTLTASSCYSFEIKEYRGSVEFNQALRGALRQVPGVVVESVDYDPATKMVSFFSARSLRELPHPQFIQVKLREAGFIQGNRSRQQDAVLAVTIGPSGVSPLARESLQTASAYAGGRPAPPVPTGPETPAGSVVDPAGTPLRLPESPAWQVQADPGPTRTGAPRSINLPPNQTVRDIHFADPPVERALIPTRQPPGTVLAYDTGTGQQVGSALLDTKQFGQRIVLSKEKLLGYSPDGTLALTYQEDLDQLRTARWEKGHRSTLSALQLHNGELFEAFFVTNRHVALVCRRADSNPLMFWPLHGKPPIVYELESIPSSKLQIIRTSPGRKFFAVVLYHSVHLFHAETGAAAGRIDFPTAKGFPWIYGVTFSPDGKLLVLYTGEDSTRGSGRGILFPFDMATGKPLPQIYVADGYITDPTFHWQGSRFLTLGPVRKIGERRGFSLVDLQQSAPVITYLFPQREWSNSFTDQSDPSGTIWCYSNESEFPDFTPLTLPRPADLQEIDQSLAQRPIALQATEEVAVEVKLETPSPIAKFREQVEQSITQRLTEQGRRVSPTAAKRLVVTIKQTTRDGTITVPIHYKLAGIAPQREEIAIPNHPVEVTLQLLDTSGQATWQLETGYNPVFVIATEDTPNEMCKERPHQAADVYRWVRVKQFFQWYALPSPLYPSAEPRSKEISLGMFGAKP